MDNNPSRSIVSYPSRSIVSFHCEAGGLLLSCPQIAGGGTKCCTKCLRHRHGQKYTTDERRRAKNIQRMKEEEEESSSTQVHSIVILSKMIDI